MGKGACCQAWRPDVYPWEPHDCRREQTVTFPLISSHVIWHACAHTITCTCIQIMNIRIYSDEIIADLTSSLYTCAYIPLNMNICIDC